MSVLVSTNVFYYLYPIKSVYFSVFTSVDVGWSVSLSLESSTLPASDYWTDYCETFHRHSQSPDSEFKWCPDIFSNATSRAKVSLYLVQLTFYQTCPEGWCLWLWVTYWMPWRLIQIFLFKIIYNFGDNIIFSNCNYFIHHNIATIVGTFRTCWWRCTCHRTLEQLGFSVLPNDTFMQTGGAGNLTTNPVASGQPAKWQYIYTLGLN